MLGDALTKDKADAADLLRACVRVSASHESSTPRQEREAWSLAKASGGVQNRGQRTNDLDVPGRTRRRGTNRVIDNGRTGAHEGELPSQGRVAKPNLPLKRERGKVTLQARDEHEHIRVTTVASLEERVLQMVVDLERDFVKWLRRKLHMDMKCPYSLAVRYFREQLTDCPNTHRQWPESQGYSEAVRAVADCGARVLENFPRERVIK